MHRHQISALMALVGLLAFAGCNKQSSPPAPASAPAPMPVATTSHNKIVYRVKENWPGRAEAQLMVKKGDKLVWKVGSNGKPFWIHFKDDGYCTNPSDPNQTNFEGTSTDPATCTIAVEDTSGAEHPYKIYDKDPLPPPPPPKGKRKEKPFSKPRSCGGCAVYGGS